MRRSIRMRNSFGRTILGAGLWTALWLGFAAGASAQDVPASISGQVVSASDQSPIAGANVRAVSFAPDGTSVPQAVLETQTDPNGAFVFDTLPILGPWLVVVRAMDFRDGIQDLFVDPGEQATLFFALVPIDIPPGAIGGKVIDAQTGDPIAEASIVIEGIATFAPILTDANGEFFFDGVPPGERRVWANKPGYETGLEIVLVEPGQAAVADFALQPLDLPPPGAIEGEVADAVTGEPIEGARVRYRRIELDSTGGTPTDGTTDSSIQPWPFVETNELGQYRIEDLRPGQYALRSEAEEYFPAWQGTFVGTGETSLVNFELEPIVPGMAGTIAGIVTDAESGNPIGGAVVFFSPFDGEIALPPEIPDMTQPYVRTGPDGRYETPPLASGLYYLLVRAEGFEPARDVVEVAAGEQTIADFALVPFEPADSGAIAGTVTDAATGDPIAGALVFFFPAASTLAQLDFDPSLISLDQVPRVQTDANGRYMIDALRPGLYGLAIREPGFVPALELAEVISAEVTIVDFALVPDDTPPLGGIAGTVIDAQFGTPLAGAFIFFAPVDPGAAPPIEPGSIDPASSDEDIVNSMGMPYVRTGPNGRYAIPRLEPGAYLVLAWRRGYSPDFQIVGVEAGQVTIADFALAPLDPVEPGAITGFVQDGFGRPVAGAWVFYGPALNMDAMPRWIDEIEAGFPNVRTDENGQYLIAPLRPGPYQIHVRAEGFAPADKRVEVVSGEAAQCNFILMDFDPPEPGSIAGIVREAGTGAPIGGAKVFFGPLFDDDLAPWWFEQSSATGGPDAPYVETDAQGRYIIDALRPGTYRVLARAAGFFPADDVADVGAGEVVEVNFDLEPDVPPEPGNIAGRVTDGPTGEGIAGATVAFYRLPDDLIELDERFAPSTLGGPMPTPDAPPAVLTDENGFYAIDGLRPGRYRLAARADGYLAASKIVEVQSGQTTECNFALDPMPVEIGAIFGRVIDALTEDGLEGANVWVIPGGEVVIADVAPAIVLGEAVTGINGEYEIGGLPVGRLRAMAAKEGYRQERKLVEIVSGEAAECNFALQPIPMIPRGVLAGRVLAARNERPLVRALVILIPDNAIGFALSRRPGHVRHTLTDRDGRYAFRDVPAGRYTVVASKRRFETARQRVEILPGELTRASFLLELAEPPEFGALGGRIIDATTGEPIAGAVVRVQLDDHDWLINRSRRRTRTNEDGIYAFRHLKVGSYEMHVSKRGYLPEVGEARVFADQETRQNFELTPGTDFGAVQGVVTDAITGDPIAEARVVIPLFDPGLMANSDNALSVRTDEAGRYRIEDVPAGMRIVVALKRGYFPDAKIAAVRPNETSEVNFDLIPRPSDGTLRIECIDDRRLQPITGVMLSVPISDWIEPGSELDDYRVQTGADGSALFSGLPGDIASVLGLAEGFHARFGRVDAAVAQATANRAASAGAAAEEDVLQLSFALDTSLRNAATGWARYR